MKFFTPSDGTVVPDDYLDKYETAFMLALGLLPEVRDAWDPVMRAGQLTAPIRIVHSDDGWITFSSPGLPDARVRAAAVGLP